MTDMVAPIAGAPAPGQPIVGTGSRQIYHPTMAQLVKNVAAEDVALLTSLGFTPVEESSGVTSIIAGTGISVDQADGDVTVTNSAPAAGATAGPFTAITAITVVNGLVTVLTGT